MIIEAILIMFKGLVGVALTPISVILMPIGSLAGWIELLAYASLFVPISTLSVAFGIYLTYYGIQFGVSVVNWLIAKIPTIE